MHTLVDLCENIIQFAKKGFAYCIQYIKKSVVKKQINFPLF